MSKIVILGAQLAAPQILGDLLAQIGAQDPIYAKWAEDLDFIPIIKECAQKALNRLGQIEGIKKCDNVLDYYGKAYDGKLAGAIKTDKLPNGLGVKINAQGDIQFLADEYRQEWKDEIKRLRKLFTDAFLVEIANFYLQSDEYEVHTQSTTGSNGQINYDIEGVKYAKN